jgi:hypothetical protein
VSEVLGEDKMASIRGRQLCAVAIVVAAVLIPFAGPARAGSDGLTPAQEQLAQSSIPKVVVMDPVTGKILSIQPVVGGSRPSVSTPGATSFTVF